VRQLAIVGAGSWGTALAIVLAPRFESLRLWAFDAGLAESIASRRENDVYLPGCPVPNNVEPTADLIACVRDAPVMLLVVPSQFLRAVLRRLPGETAPDVIFVSAAKGIEKGTLARMSQVIDGEFPGAPIAVLSGPTFAREVACGGPAAVVISSTDCKVSQRIQTAFSGPSFRLYTNADPVGVEIGAALKNVIAIGAGICQGLGLGHNSVAALITRGLAEITRLAVALGGDARTLAGLAGLGDLVLTCTGELSRNRRVGVELARGRSLDDIVGSTKMIAEGIETTDAAVELACRRNVEMPIVSQMHAVLRHGKQPRDAIRYLMDRTLKSE
jgi:glycerol-3-phosphate dehydrogenase (NAD(P)+)